MNDKKEKEISFQVDLHWLSKQNGAISSEDVEGIIHVAAPPVFGGEGRPWTPEHLFLGSISSCFMTTYFAFAKKVQLDVRGLTCKATGVISLQGGKLVFTRIDLYSKVSLASEELFEKANLVLEKSKKYCIISNAVLPKPTYHCEFLAEEQAAIIAELNINKTA